MFVSYNIISKLNPVKKLLFIDFFLLLIYKSIKLDNQDTLNLAYFFNLINVK